MKKQEYKNCNHVLVYTNIDHDYYEGRSYRSSGCIKCGLDGNVLDYDREWLGGHRRIQYDFLRSNYLNGLHTYAVCDLQLPNAIYNYIIERHPNIDDETLVEYFQRALKRIRKKIKEEKPNELTKRFKLEPDFKRWFNKY